MTSERFMSIDEMKASMQRTFGECMALREAGQAEYAGGENALGNFVRLATELGTSPERVLWVYLRKHIDGIAAWIRGHRSQREPVQGRINDAIVYLGLLRGMIDSEVGTTRLPITKREMAGFEKMMTDLKKDAKAAPIGSLPSVQACTMPEDA